jgi:hypothetical protein
MAAARLRARKLNCIPATNRRQVNETCPEDVTS